MQSSSPEDLRSGADLRFLRMTAAWRISKSEDGAEGDAEVILRALIEIDFVAGFEAEADGAEGGFDSGGGIDGCVQVAGAEAEDGAGEVAVGEQAGAEAEIHEAGFEGEEGTESAAGGLKPGTDEAMGDADRSVFDGGEISVGEVAVGFVEVDAVVVGEFAFHEYVVVDAVTEAAAESEVIGAGLRDVQVIDEDTEFDAFLGEERGGCEE